ncbi:MAG TPA: tRNA threonylcarbamoyladenosine dehydratase [Tissierellaceae bacterium]|nr:tRNA threonylcarbamoyladenosine dehydratase [Tissierellaceae bacterium]
MSNKFQRTELLLGKEAMDKLEKSTVAVFGVGGVGSYATEAIVRSGVGKIILVDYDRIDVTNINRQVHANMTTIGQYKVDVMRERLMDINPNLKIKVFREKYNKDNKENLINKDYDYVIDAIDMVSSKVDLITTCKSADISIISSMGAGNKLSPTMLQVGDIYNTKICPLAKVMRRELRRRDVKDLKVIWSEEIPMKINLETRDLRKAIPGSIAFVPPVAGLIVASEVIKDLIIKEG